MRLPGRASTFGWLVVLALCSMAACGPAPTPSAKAPLGSPSTSPVSPASPSVTPNPNALEPNDCTAPAASNGIKVHSPGLGATVTLPPGWTEDPTMEGQQGMQTTFDLIPGGGRPPRTTISADHLPFVISPHDALPFMASQPGA